jgi:aminoglycoside phosphotransferase (APT) family kinase protein
MRPTMLLDLPSQQVDREFYLCSYLFRHGIRVPEPLWLETDAEVTGLPFMVCRRMPGDIFGTAVSATPVSGVQVRDMAFELARIHAVGRGDADDENLRRSAIAPGQFDATLSDVVREYIDSWHRIWRGLELEPNPGVEATLVWLDEAMPAVDDTPVFLHGDYALHNVLLDADGVSAVLDWELSRVGDRAEELSWLFSATTGSIDPDEFMAAYVEAGGRPVDEFRLRYYEVLSHLKLLVVCLESQLRFEQLSEPEPAYCRFGLGLVQHPMQALAGAIERAEIARPE